MNVTIQNALLPTKTGYQTCDVQVTGDKITAIAAALEPQGKAIDATHKLLLPGFFNAHTHSSEMWQRGAIAPLPLELWLSELYSSPDLTPEKIYLSALGTAVETLLSGGTSVIDHLVMPPGQELEAIAAVVRGYREVGIRAFVAPLVQDLAAKEGLPSGNHKTDYQPYSQSTAEILAWMETAIKQFHRPEEGISLMVGPTGLQLCTDELFQGCITLSDRYSLCRHTHLLETKAQQRLAYEKYGHSAVEHLSRLGFLGPQTSLAHCVWLDQADIPVLAASGASVVHNPLSNLRLGSGIAPILQYRQAGINVTFGCDGTASNDSQDILEAIKIGTLLHNTTEPDYQHWITPTQAIAMATQGGARAVNLSSQLGILTVGQQADFVLYDLTSLALLPPTDPVGLLVMGRPVNSVDSIWVRGRQLVEAGQVLSTDISQLRQRFLTTNQWQRRPLNAATAQLAHHYRAVMGLAN
ncbi:MAG: amidohydrolase [Leptolyngbyaceae cyanobacterium SM1_1_3]|nr:amidohydrolase [Leptolyngbyaceae cyanobacterium SM1_1_3]NJN03316.1 amidohydrolase [Leptolyngbyaceae cyanobacterium RM1_1_2]